MKLFPFHKAHLLKKHFNLKLPRGLKLPQRSKGLKHYKSAKSEPFPSDLMATLKSPNNF